MSAKVIGMIGRIDHAPFKLPEWQGEGYCPLACACGDLSARLWDVLCDPYVHWTKPVHDIYRQHRAHLRRLFAQHPELSREAADAMIQWLVARTRYKFIKAMGNDWPEVVPHFVFGTTGRIPVAEWHARHRQTCTTYKAG